MYSLNFFTFLEIFVKTGKKRFIFLWLIAGIGYGFNMVSLFTQQYHIYKLDGQYEIIFQILGMMFYPFGAVMGLITILSSI